MRSMIFASLSLIFGAATAFAGDDPPQQPANAAPATATTTATATPSSAAPAATPAAAPATAATTAHASSTQVALTDDDKKLIAQGYKLYMKDGQKTFCRREVALGSHFEKKVCGTAEQLGQSQRDAKDIAAQSQQARGTNPTGP